MADGLLHHSSAIGHMLRAISFSIEPGAVHLAGLDGTNWPLGVENSAFWKTQVRRTLTLKWPWRSMCQKSLAFAPIMV